MKCGKCKKEMKHVRNIKFNEHTISGWKCSCGEIYYDPEDADRVLLLNKLKDRTIKAKLGRVRSNLILRLPRDIEAALKLEKGADVLITFENDGFKIIPA